LNKDKVPLDPQYEIYKQYDATGGMFVVTVRDLGKLVGYFVGFAAPGLHYKTCLTLTMDIFYILPEYRGSGAGLQLFQMVEKEAVRRGIKRMLVGSKLHKDASWLFEKLGYIEIERWYSKTWG
jgi:GNAT superfamily N-acetyltransferase